MSVGRAAPRCSPTYSRRLARLGASRHTDLHKVAVINLGCPKNLVDAEVMLGNLAAAGFAVTGDAGDADVVVVNTCGFLRAAAQEAVDTLLEASELKRTGRCRAVVAAGCMTQRYGADLAQALPEVDGFIGVGQAHQLPDIVRRALQGERPQAVVGPAAGFEGYGLRLQSTGRSTAYVKLSEGCDRCCSFCTIPSIRGPMVSRDLGAVVAEATALAENGVREIVLIGQDPTRYGVDGGSHRLVELLERLSTLERLRWVRVMYLFPDRQAAPVLEAIGSLPRMCRYVDMPVQHVAARVLRAMNRPGDAGFYRSLFARLRTAAPQAAIRTTFLVGFPGESSEDFAALHDFIAEGQIDWLGGFAYSREEGTAAAQMRPQVPARVARGRYETLMETQAAVTERRLRARMGAAVEVLVEGTGESGDPVGRFDGQAPDVDGVVRFDANGFACKPGDFVRVRLTGTDGYDLLGQAEAIVEAAANGGSSGPQLRVLS